MSAGVIRWEAPPPVRLGRQPSALDHEAIAAELRATPGEWGLIAVGAVHSGITSAIETGRISPYRPAGSFQATRRQVGDEQRVYCRFVGALAGEVAS